MIMNVVGINEQVPAMPGAAFHSRCYKYHIYSDARMYLQLKIIRQGTGKAVT